MKRESGRLSVGISPRFGPRSVVAKKRGQRRGDREAWRQMVSPKSLLSLNTSNAWSLPLSPPTSPKTTWSSVQKEALSQDRTLPSSESTRFKSEVEGAMASMSQWVRQSAPDPAALLASRQRLDQAFHASERAAVEPALAQAARNHLQQLSQEHPGVWEAHLTSIDQGEGSAEIWATQRALLLALALQSGHKALPEADLAAMIPLRSDPSQTEACKVALMHAAFLKKMEPRLTQASPEVRSKFDQHFQDLAIHLSEMSRDVRDDLLKAKLPESLDSFVEACRKKSLLTSEVVTPPVENGHRQRFLNAFLLGGVGMLGRGVVLAGSMALTTLGWAPVAVAATGAAFLGGMAAWIAPKVWMQLKGAVERFMRPQESAMVSLA